MLARDQITTLAPINITSDMQGIIWGEPDLAVTMQS